MTAKVCPSCRSTFDADLSEALDGGRCSECVSQTDSVLASHDANDETRRIGRFELIEIIGQGSFGEVWKAFDPHLDRHVAVKMPRRENLDPVEAELFLREARTAAQVQHPNVVGIHEVNRDGDQIYLVCDLIQGESLASLCSRRQCRVPEVVSIVRTMASALGHVHECGVIHRDLKPSNILMDTTGKPFLSDFGLARRIKGDVTLTVVGQLVGTPAYMSPEQARGESKKIDERSDIYSLGMVLYELLTGELPFDGTPHAVIGKVVSEAPVSPRKRNPIVPRDLETICMKCLEKDPGKRYPSAAELAVDLDRYSRGEPLLSRPIGAFGRAVRWSQRNRWKAAFGVALICVCVFGAITIRANSVAEQAVEQKKESDHKAARQEEHSKAIEVAIDNFMRQGRGEIQAEGQVENIRMMVVEMEAIHDRAYQEEVEIP